MTHGAAGRCRSTDVPFVQNKENETMAIKATATNRAPRGTKILSQAFFSAADGIPEAQRAAVVKAALAAIRDEVKNTRDKAKVAKAKAKAQVAKKPAARGPKVAAATKAAAKKAPAVVSKAKAKAKASRKSAPVAASGTTWT